MAQPTTSKLITRQGIEEAVKKLGEDCHLTKRIFDDWHTILLRICLEEGNLNFFAKLLRKRRRKELKSLGERWGNLSEKYGPLLNRSHEVAGTARALINDLLCHFIPSLVECNDLTEWQRFVPELQQQQKRVEAEYARAQDLAQVFFNLQSQVKIVFEMWKATISTDDIKKYHSVDPVLSELHTLLVRSGELSQPQKCNPEEGSSAVLQEIVLKAGPPAGGNIKDGEFVGVLLNKLGLICNIWAFIRSDLQQIALNIGYQQEVTDIQFAQRRNRKIKENMENLSSLLEQYQINFAQTS